MSFARGLRGENGSGQAGERGNEFHRSTAISTPQSPLATDPLSGEPYAALHRKRPKYLIRGTSPILRSSIAYCGSRCFLGVHLCAGTVFGCLLQTPLFANLFVDPPAPKRLIRRTGSLLCSTVADQSVFQVGFGEAPFSKRRPPQRFPGVPTPAVPPASACGRD